MDDEEDVVSEEAENEDDAGDDAGEADTGVKKARFVFVDITQQLTLKSSEAVIKLPKFHSSL